VISAIAGILIWVVTHPGGVLNPTQPTPAAALGGSVSNVQMSNGQPCCTFTVRVTIQGFNGQTCQLDWILVNAVSDAKTTAQVGARLTPQADLDTAEADVMVSVTIPGRYYARFILLDPNGTELASANSPVFNATSP
jgi:hypothetical protein